MSNWYPVEPNRNLIWALNNIAELLQRERVKAHARFTWKSYKYQRTDLRSNGASLT